MNDLQFIIINSKDFNAHVLLPELQNRVSFDVYQETLDEPVWSVMEGGKDDMYVYDRCGRLTYFVPFPLSVLTDEQPIIATAVMATYFRSPCGATCETNSSSALDEFMSEIESDANTPSPEQESNSTNLTYPDYEYSTESYPFLLSNETMPDEKNPVDGKDTTNQTDVFLRHKFMYHMDNDTMDQIYNETIDHGVTNDSSIHKSKSIFDNLYNYFFGNKNASSTAESLFNETTTTDSLKPFPSNYSQEDYDDESENETESHENSTRKSNDVRKITEGANGEIKTERKRDRCAEADTSVCQSWSKKRLLHAQNCCPSENKEVAPDSYQSCRNFGKKRCKKIQTILKCCIKTMLMEEYSTDAPVTNALVPTETVTEDTNEVVCCKEVSGGKLCRVSETSLCFEDEYVADSPDMTK